MTLYRRLFIAAAMRENLIIAGNIIVTSQNKSLSS